MPIIELQPTVEDIISLSQRTVMAGTGLGENTPRVLDPNSPDYNPDLIPRDPETGIAFTDSIGDPESPDYDPEMPNAQPSIWDVAKDDWVTTKAVQYMARKAFDDDPHFTQPWGELTEDYDPYASAFAEARSRDEWDYIKYSVDQSLELDEYMAGADLKDGAAYFGVQMLDPALAPLYLINLPLATAGKILTGGKAVASAGMRVGAYSAAEATVIEGVLQVTDPTRTWDESVTTAIAAGTAGALLGSAGAAVMQRFAKRIPEIQDDSRQIVESAFISARAATDGDSAGAASIATTLADEKPLFNITKNITLRSPTFRLLYDDISATASRSVDLLVPHNLLKTKNVQGIAPPDTPLFSAIMQAREKNTAIMIGTAQEAKKALRRRGLRYSDTEIGTMIGKAARRNDTHELPEIQAAAEQFRRVVDEWGQRARRVGLITEDALESVESYFPRLYDTRKISAKYDVWKQKITGHFANKYPDLESAELDDIAASIHNQLMNVPINQMHLGSFTPPATVLKSGHLKGRKLDMSDIDLEDFLIDDVRYVTQHYMRTMAPSVLVREMFSPDDIGMVDGYPVINSIMQKMDEEYKIAKNAVPAGKSTKKIDAQWKRARNDMRYLMSSVMGYGNPKQGMAREGDFWREASSELRSYTAAASLGGMVLRAIPDMANTILAHGLGNLMRSMPAIVVPTKWGNLAKADFKAMAIGVDTLLSTRMLRMADIESSFLNAYSRGIGGQAVANGSFKFFGANLWNSWMKRATATAAQNRILKDVTNYSKLGKARKAKLASLGINESWANRFSENFSRQNRKTYNGVNYADLDNWDDEAASYFERVLFRDVETTIVTPQAGDAPIITDNAIGAVAAQFKRFVMGQQMQIMSQASTKLAVGDIAVLNYIVAAGGLALMGEYMYTQVKNGFDQDAVEEHWSKQTPSDLIFASFDRSAMLSFGTDMIMGIDGLTDGTFGQMLGFSDTAKYTPQGLGLEYRIPGFGYVSKGVKTVDAVADAAVGAEQFSRKDLHTMRQMIPLQNTFYLSWLFDQLENGIAETFDLPETSRSGSSAKRY